MQPEAFGKYTRVLDMCECTSWNVLHLPHEGLVERLVYVTSTETLLGVREDALLRLVVLELRHEVHSADVLLHGGERHNACYQHRICNACQPVMHFSSACARVTVIYGVECGGERDAGAIRVSAACRRLLS